MELSEGLTLSGKIKIDTYKAGFVEAVAPYLEQRARFRLLRDATGEVADIDEIIAGTKAKYFLRTAVECHNLIMGSSGFGYDIIIQRLVGVNTYSLNILYAELGTGTTPPTLADTGLTTPTNRIAVGFQQDYGSTDAVLQFFISDSQLANGTYPEFGSFIDGTATIGSGQIFNHALLSPSYVKTAGTDTTIQLDVSISNS
jgi:hypothetical protein